MLDTLFANDYVRYTMLGGAGAYLLPRFGGVMVGVAVFCGMRFARTTWKYAAWGKRKGLN